MSSQVTTDGHSVQLSAVAVGVLHNYSVTVLSVIILFLTCYIPT